MISRKKKIKETPFKSPLDLSIGYQNIEGIHSPTFGCKLPYIHTKFIHDIEVLSETWGACDHEKNTQGYTLMGNVHPHKKSNIKKGRASGGLLIYCKNELSKHVKKVKITPYLMWFTIDKSIFFEQNKTVKVCFAYNPPKNSKYCDKEFYDEISRDLLEFSHMKCPVIIMGDLNSRTGELKDFNDLEKNVDLNITPPSPHQKLYPKN